GIRSEQNPFHPTEHGCICADTQDEAQNCQRGKAWAATQLPKAVAKVLNKILHDASPASVAAPLFDLREPAHRAHGRAARLFIGHAFRNVLVNLLLEMSAQLFFYFLFHFTGMNEGMPTQGQGIDPLFDLHVQASLSWTIPEMAAETRFQLAVSSASCLRPTGVKE